MLRCNELEATVGIEQYYTRTPGIGGIVKKETEDFIVSEILDGGLDASKQWAKDPLLTEPARYTLWILKKQDRETIPTIAVLAKILGMRSLKAKICGIKDRRALTYQYVALPLTRATSPARLTLNGAEARQIGHIDKLDSSKLLMNRFEIIIRDTKANSDLLEDFRQAAQELGTPNYFGHQRFGLLRPVTHLVGMKIVKGDLRGAVETFLTLTTDFEPEPVKVARRELEESGDYSRALNYFPASLTYERRILKHLSKKPEDYLGALRRLPLRIRRLFVDAYSSYLFNKALSASLKDGLRLDEPAVGDLLVRLDRFQRPIGRPLQVTNGNLEEVHRRASKGEAAVIIPSPGYLSWMPGGPRGEALKNILDSEGVQPRNFKLRNMPEASTSGTLRPIMLRPLSLTISEVDRDTVRVETALPPSSYATSLLRELMKRECALAYTGLTHCYA